MGLESVFVVLVLKNDAECTSRRVKRTSGARVLIFIFCRSLARGQRQQGQRQQGQRQGQRQKGQRQGQRHLLYS